MPALSYCNNFFKILSIHEVAYVTDAEMSGHPLLDCSY